MKDKFSSFAVNYQVQFYAHSVKVVEWTPLITLMGSLKLETPVGFVGNLYHPYRHHS